METAGHFRAPRREAKSARSLRALVEQTAALWSGHALDYDAVRHVTREIRRRLGIARPAFRRRREAPAVSPEEARRFLQAVYGASGEPGALLRLLVETGLRPSEAALLRARDFHPKTGSLSCGDRIFRLSPELSRSLAAADARPRAYLFESNRRGPYSPRRIQQIVRAAAREAGIDRRVDLARLRRAALRPGEAATS